MRKLLKHKTIDKIKFKCWFAGYDINCNERYEYVTSNGAHAYFLR